MHIGANRCVANGDTGAVTVAASVWFTDGMLNGVGGAMPPDARVGALMLTTIFDPAAVGWNAVESDVSPGLNTTGLMVMVPLGDDETATSNGPIPGFNAPVPA